MKTPFKLKYKNSAFPFKTEEEEKKKKDERTERQKQIDEGIEKGSLPNPDTEERLKQWKEAYFYEKLV